MTAIESRVVEANGARIHCEVRGRGPAVLFISGATGDAGHFAHVADVLADEFRVIHYDRRGNSRSPRPAGWVSTSIQEQAADAAALLDVLGASPAVVFGTSAGGTILVDLVSRRPDVVRGAIVHEPVLAPVSPRGADVGSLIARIRQDGFAKGGSRAAQELFLRWAASDEVFEAVDPDVRERLLDNGEVFFGLELERIVSYAPDATALRRSGVPIVVASGAASKGTTMVEGSEWLARELGCEQLWLPGYHTPYLHPEQSQPFAEALRPIIRQLSA
jgi:pimeloyl-ACP methyl ester carboxylesterase